MVSRCRTPASRGSAAVIVVIVLLCVGVLLYIGLYVAARLRTSAAVAGWSATLGDPDAMLARHPAAGANAAALASEALAAALGIDLAPRVARGDRSRPSQERRDRFEAVKQVLGSYSTEQLGSSVRGAIGAPPPELVRYAEEHERALEAFRRGLIDGEVPRWESDLSRMQAAPIPNLLGQIDAHNLLTSLALARVHAGDAAGALDDLEASWKLARSLEGSPLLICQLIRMAALRMQIGLLRHVPDAPPIWADRLRGLELRREFLEAMRYEGWVWLYADTGPTPGNRLSNLVFRPYVELCLADASDSWRRRIDRLEAAGAICDRDLVPLALDLPIPRWNTITGRIEPSLDDSIRRESRLELDIELTRLVLEADESRRANGGRWPVDAPTPRESGACPGDRWSYGVLDDRLEIAFSREIEWPGRLLGATLPTRVVLPAD